MDFISSHDKAHLVWILLIRTVIDAYAAICDILTPVGWEVLLVDEEKGVGTLYSTGDSLCYSTDLIAVGTLPHLLIFRIADEMLIWYQFAGGFV